MGLLENVLGIKQSDDYTVKDNRTGREVDVRDAKDLEKFAQERQREHEEDHRDFFQRIFSR